MIYLPVGQTLSWLSKFDHVLIMSRQSVMSKLQKPQRRALFKSRRNERPNEETKILKVAS